MHDFEQQDDRLDDHVQIEPLDPLQERKIDRIFQLLGFDGNTHRWRQKGMLIGLLISFLALLGLLVFSNTFSLSTPRRNSPFLPSPLFSTARPLELAAATPQVVYVANQADDSLTALQAQTGAMLWRFHAGGIRVKVPCLLMDALLYCTAFQGQEGTVNAIQIQNGNLLWWQRLPAEAYPVSLSVVNQIVYVILQQPATQQSSVLALRADDGTVLWHYQQTTPNAFLLHVVDGIVYLNTPDGSLLVALQATTGRVLWSMPTNEAHWFLASADGKTYIQSEQGSIAALQSWTGALIWHYQTTSSTPPLVAGENVYLPSSDGTLLALRAQDGALLWQQKHLHTLTGTLSLADGLLYVSTSDGMIDAFQARNGSLLWQAHLSSLPDQQLMVINKQLYLHTRDGSLSVWQARTGTLLWRYHVGPLSLGQTTLQVVDHVVYVMAQDGRLSALLEQTGSSLWSIPNLIEQPVLVDHLIYVSLQNATIRALLLRAGTTRWSFSDPV